LPFWLALAPLLFASPLPAAFPVPFNPAIHQSIRYLVQNGRLVTPTDNKQSYLTEGYNKNALVYSVINKILNKAVLPEWGLYKVVDEKKLKESERLMLQKHVSFKDIKRAKELKAEAVEPLTKYERINRKFEKFFFPRIKKPIQDKINSLTAVVNTIGVNAGISYINQKLVIEGLTLEVQRLYEVVGVRHANDNTRGLKNQPIIKRTYR